MGQCQKCLLKRKDILLEFKQILKKNANCDILVWIRTFSTIMLLKCLMIEIEKLDIAEWIQRGPFSFPQALRTSIVHAVVEC